MSYPILKPNSTWFAPNVSTIKRSTITTINIVDTYTPEDMTTVTDSWDASASQDGSITCYVEGTVLTIAGNGSGKIMANEDSSYMFYVSSSDRFSALTIINNFPLIDFSNCTITDLMFTECIKLTSVDVTQMNVSNVVSMRKMFSKCNSIPSLDLSAWKTDSLTDMYAMFNACSVMTSVNLTGWDTSKVTNLAFLFNLCYKLEQFDCTVLNAAKPTSLQQMFQQCNLLTELDVSGWDVSNVTNMSYVFYNCDGLTTLPLENWDVSNVDNFDHTFAHCNNLVVDVSKWKVTNKCKYFGAMFHSNANTFLDVSGFDTSGAISLFSMFEANPNLVEIKGLENFDTSNSAAFEEMFSGCYSLKELDLSSWDTRKANSTTRVRSDASSYTSQVTKGMFAGCRSLEKIKLGKNFTFAGDGTAANTYYGTLPAPSSTYIDGADGKWYTIDGIAYAPADIPNLTAATYYASPKLAKYERNKNQYVSLNGIEAYHIENMKYINNAISNQTADWNQTDETATNYIKNRPTLATSEEVKALFN